jgi:hypothetical protein
MLYYKMKCKKCAEKSYDDKKNTRINFYDANKGKF